MKRIAITLVFLAACGGSSGSTTDTPDAGTQPDTMMAVAGFSGTAGSAAGAGGSGGEASGGQGGEPVKLDTSHIALATDGGKYRGESYSLGCWETSADHCTSLTSAPLTVTNLGAVATGPIHLHIGSSGEFTESSVRQVHQHGESEILNDECTGKVLAFGESCTFAFYQCPNLVEDERYLWACDSAEVGGAVPCAGLAFKHTCP